MELRGPPRGRDLDEAEVGKLLNLALDAGMEVIDTSIDYESSEERIGRHIGHRRDESFLASKCGCLVGWTRTADYAGGQRGGGPHDFSRANIVAGVEQSLRRLRTDYLDLLQVHASPDVATLQEHDVIETLQNLRHEGKIRLIGMSGVLPDVMDHIDLGVFDVFQMPYSSIQLDHEQAIIRAAASGAGVLVRGGIGRGVGSGSSLSRQRGKALADTWEKANIERLLGPMTAMEFALRFTMSTEGVSSVIVGTASIDHLKANIDAASRGPLPPDLIKAARDRLIPAAE